MKSIDAEIKFLADTHEKAVAKRVGDEEFLERCKALFLSGDISQRALEAAKILYGEEDELPFIPKKGSKKAPSPSSSGCGSPTTYSSGCGSSSRSSSAC